MSGSRIATSRRGRWVTRKVRGGSVVIDGRTYRPVHDAVPYASQLDGYRCLFSRHILKDGSTSHVVDLWGVWDQDELEYLDDRGPHRVGDRFPFATWSATDEEPA